MGALNINEKSEYNEKFYLTMYGSEENMGNDRVGC